METGKSTGKKTSLNIASTLCWVLGAMNLFGGIGFIRPTVSMGRSISFPAAIITLGIGLCVAGYGLRKKRRYAGIMAVIFGLSAVASPPVIGTIIGMTIIVLAVINWKELS